METSCELCKFICKIFKLSPQKPCKANFFKASLEVVQLLLCSLWYLKLWMNKLAFWKSGPDRWLRKSWSPQTTETRMCMCLCMNRREKSRYFVLLSDSVKASRRSAGVNVFHLNATWRCQFRLLVFFAFILKRDWEEASLIILSFFEGCLKFLCFRVLLLWCFPFILVFFFFIYRCSGSVSSLCSRLYKCTAYLLFSFPQSE